VLKINEYLESGILESFVLGEITPEEERELMAAKVKYPEIKDALEALEADMERLAQLEAINPPPGNWSKIEAHIQELQRTEARILTHTDYTETKHKNGTDNYYINVESSSNHIRIHKLWRWAFVFVFLLGKIFLAFAIYFFLESRQAKEEIKELKMRILHIESHK